MEVRYLARDVDDATRGGAFLARLHESVVQEIKAALADSGDASRVAAWDEWLRFSGRVLERPGIIEYLSGVWPGLRSLDVKRQVLLNQVRPFTFTEDDVQQLLA